MAATILGQGKNAWQAEIDAAAEVGGFSRFLRHIFTKQLSPSALRLLPFRGQVRRGTLFATTARKLTRGLEVSSHDPPLINLFL